MSTSAVHIELSWLSCILAAYLDVLGTTTYVESLLETERILLAVNGNSTLATYVDDTQLAVVEQILLIVWLVCIERSDRSQLQRSGCWLSTTNEEAARTWCMSSLPRLEGKHLLDSEFTAKAVCCIVLCIHRIACTNERCS